MDMKLHSLKGQMSEKWRDGREGNRRGKEDLIPTS